MKHHREDPTYQAYNRGELTKRNGCAVVRAEHRKNRIHSLPRMLCEQESKTKRDKESISSEFMISLIKKECV